jgi:hypothetical protein
VKVLSTLGVLEMTTNTNTNTATVTVTEGHELAALWAKREAADRRVFKRDIADGGFDNRLGKLLVQLYAENPGTYLDKAVVKAHKLDVIPGQRRSDALWFAREGDSELVQGVLQASKRGFTSLAALKQACDKAAKKAEKDAKVSSEGEGEGEGEGASEDKGVNFANLAPHEVIALITRNFTVEAQAEIARAIAMNVKAKAARKAA